jgi:alcohol dehydrogenase (cytochrome c)
MVVDGVMFVSGWDGYVWVLNATNGKLLWQYRHAIPLDVPLCCGNVSRGVAVARGKVFVATQMDICALDATNGRPVWQQIFVDIRAGESATVAPLVVKNLVIVGSSGGEYGVRGHIDACDLDTGRRVWRRHNVPKPGEPESETWPVHDWARGAGRLELPAPTTRSWTWSTGALTTLARSSTVTLDQEAIFTPALW